MKKERQPWVARSGIYLTTDLTDVNQAKQKWRKQKTEIIARARQW